MKKNQKSALAAVAMAGLMAGFATSCRTADKDMAAETASEMSCAGKDSCGG